MTDTHSGLHSKLAEVAADLGYVERDGTNTFQNYKYTSAEAMLNAVRGPLSSRNVALLESVDSIEDREYTTTKGKASVITTVRLVFTFVDGDTGQREELAWLGRGDDNADKGLGKAYTNAVKTFLRAQFLIPSGDDPEADHRTDERAADRAPRDVVPQALVDEAVAAMTAMGVTPEKQRATLEGATVDLLKRVIAKANEKADTAVPA